MRAATSEMRADTSEMRAAYSEMRVDTSEARAGGLEEGGLLERCTPGARPRGTGIVLVGQRMVQRTFKGLVWCIIMYSHFKVLSTSK